MGIRSRPLNGGTAAAALREATALKVCPIACSGNITSVPMQVDGTTDSSTHFLFASKSLLPVHGSCAPRCLFRKEEAILV